MSHDGGDRGEPARHAAILAGGLSRRMGAPKAAMDLAGRPLISYPIAAARGAGLEPLVVAKAATPLPPLGCPLIREPDEPVHPLAGIVAALEHLAAPAIVLACDLPLLPPALLSELAARRAPFAMPAVPRAQPLVARYSPELLPQLRAGLARNEPLSLVAEGLGGDLLGAGELARFGDPGWIFANVNDRAELEAIESRLVHGPRRD